MIAASTSSVASGGRQIVTQRCAKPHPSRSTARPRLPLGIDERRFLTAVTDPPEECAAIGMSGRSIGARAEELLSAMQGDEDPGQQLIAVVRKGSRNLQHLPASPDAFV